MRSAVFRALSIGALLLLPPAFARAGVGVWTTTGPEGATVLSLAVDPGDPAQVYAGTDAGGVFASSDAGTHWSFAGLGGQRIVRIVIDPVDTSRLYAQSASRLYRSTNRGASWADISAGLPLDSSGPGPFTSVSLSALAIEPGAPGAVYAGVTSSTLGGTHVYLDGTLYKSADRGETWSATGLWGASVTSIVFDSADSQTLYGAVTAGGTLPQPSSIRKSADGGLTWTTVRSNLPAWATATAMAGDPAAGGRIFAAYSNYAGPSFVELTSDGGATWLPLAPPPSGDPTALALARGLIYLATSTALYRSSDSGSTWAGLLGSEVKAVRIAPTEPTTIYSGGDGVSVSRDTGDTWTSSQAGLTNTSISSLGAAASPTGSLYSFGGHTVFQRNAGEDGWRPFSSLPKDVFVQSVAIHPTNPSIQLAGIILSGGFCRGVLASTDGGASWAPSGLNTGCILRITFDPRNSDTVFAQGQVGLWKSTDGGIHWSDVILQASFQDFAFDPSRAKVIFAATGTLGAAGHAVLKSADGGLTWIASDAGIPPSLYGCSADGTVCPKRGATAIAADPRDNSTLYAAARDLPPYDPFHPNPPAVDSGFFQSTDSGATWHLLGSGLPNTTIHAIVVDPANSDNLYVAADQVQGLFRSADRGRTFLPFDEGLANRSVSSLLIDASGLALHAATQGNGVFDMELQRERPTIKTVSRQHLTRPITAR
jgi:photosystem II stability/assembly factor-like uncharacterized protein